MGFEYKLKTKLTKEQTDEIQKLLANNIFFDKKYLFDNKEFWEFRHTDNDGELPNTNIIFESDGIYICQYAASYVWTGIEMLKEYLKCHTIDYQLIDYQE